MVPLQKKLGKKRGLKKSDQALLLKQLSSLMKHGFTLQEGLCFLIKLYHRKQRYKSLLEKMYSSLSTGQLLYLTFLDAGFSSLVVSELKLCQLHGDLSETLYHLSQQMNEEEEKWCQLKKILSYPLCLLFILLLLFLALKYFLLPQMQSVLLKTNPMSAFIIEHFSLLLLLLICFCILIFLILQHHLMSYPPLKKLSLYMKIPILATYYRFKYTYFFAYEWGRLLQLGIDTKHILNELQQTGHPIWLQCLSQEIEEGMNQGEGLLEQLKKYAFFSEDFIYFIEQGEAKGKLAEEMMMYASYLWQEGMEKLEQGMNWIQPIIFIFIGLMVIFLYATILLPLYSSF